MGLNSSGSYAKVWEIKQGKGKYYDARISISKKKDDGTYETSFSAWVRLCGEAYNKASKISAGNVIKITSFEVSTSYSKENAREYTNYAVFDFETVGNDKTKRPEENKPDTPIESAPNVEDVMPF